MKKKIQESINFLMNEFKRLKIKKTTKKISTKEKETFLKLSKFLGKKDD